MTIREMTILLYFLPATGFMIATMILFERMCDAVNAKLPKAERVTLWKIFSKRIPYTRVAALYARCYPKGNLATLHWVCLGFNVLCFAGFFFCIAIAARQ